MVADDEAAFSCFAKASKKNYGPAYYYMGLCHQSGRGTELNSKQALKFYKTGATLNDPECHMAPAEAYADGEIVKKDFRKAEKHIAEAAKHIPETHLLIKEKLVRTKQFVQFVKYRDSEE